MATLTGPQLQTLKAYIASQPDLAALPNDSDGNAAVAALLNMTAAGPNNVNWRTRVPGDDVGQTIEATAFAAITAGNNDKLSSFRAWNSVVNPSRQDHRDFFNDIFSVAAGANTRTKLLALWKEPMSRGEKVYATGTGSDASPATLVVEGTFTPGNVDAARNLP